eukprot:m.55394 g.55394  ORF g.55394 m.55394 type:complete len:539 (+) comp10982_c1_seq1:180-1796(+)
MLSKWVSLAVCVLFWFSENVHATLPPNDEFNGASSLSGWTNENPSMVDSLTVSNGVLVLVPAVRANNVWYNSLRGSFLSKSVTGNFVVDLSLHVYVPPNSNPTGNWHSAGLMAWDSNANWVVQNLGHQGQWNGVSPTAVDGTETKTNVNSVSTFNYRAAASPPLKGLLRLCRVGNDITALRWLQGETGWTMDTPFPGTTPAAISRPGFSNTIKVGIMANRMGSASDRFQADIDYIRFAPATAQSACMQAPLKASQGDSTLTVTSTTISPTSSTITETETKTNTKTETDKQTSTSFTSSDVITTFTSEKCSKSDFKHIVHLTSGTVCLNIGNCPENYFRNQSLWEASGSGNGDGYCQPCPMGQIKLGINTASSCLPVSTISSTEDIALPTSSPPSSSKGTSPPSNAKSTIWTTSSTITTGTSLTEQSSSTVANNLHDDTSSSVSVTTKTQLVTASKSNTPKIQTLTSSASPGTPQESSSKSNNNGVVYGVLGAVVALVLIVLVAVLLWRYKQNRNPAWEQMPEKPKAQFVSNPTYGNNV